MSTEAYRKRKREWAKTSSQREYRRDYMRKWREKNREQHNRLARESHRRNSYKHKDKFRESHLKYCYGITQQDFNEMYTQQEGKCLICGISFSELSKNPSVDHDHLTGEVRGLLCNSCNTKLGWYERFRNEIEKYL